MKASFLRLASTSIFTNKLISKPNIVRTGLVIVSITKFVTMLKASLIELLNYAGRDLTPY